MVADQLEDHSVLKTVQFAYRVGHSTETAVRCVLNDILCSAVRGDLVLVLFDHSKPLRRL